MSNSTQSATSHNRRSSRSNSTSSSLVTVKKAASVSSRSGSRGPPLKGRPVSPEQLGFQLTAILTSNPTRPPSGHRSRPSSVADGKGAAGNLNNVNRWSHSTSSSISGLDADQSKRRKSNSSRRLSIGPIHASSFVTNSSKKRTPPSQDSTPRPRTSQTAPPSQVPHIPPPNPPVNIAVPKSTYHRTPSRTSSSTVLATPGAAGLSTPSTSGNQPGDYFGSEWQSNGTMLPGIGVGAAEPVSGYNSAASPPRRFPDERNARSRASSSTANHVQRAESHDRIGRLGHSRHNTMRERSATNESADTAAGSSMSSNRSDKSHGHRSPTQKTMLSKALAKANTAVLLDNASNFEGAVEAYTEACELLRQVMLRSSDVEDKKKLSAIRNTYTSRVDELKEFELNPEFAEKALPQRPVDNEAQEAYQHAYYENNRPQKVEELPGLRQESFFPPRRQSLMPSSFMNVFPPEGEAPTRELETPGDLDPESVVQQATVAIAMKVPRSPYAPPPLSPRRLPSSAEQPQLQAKVPPEEEKKDSLLLDPTHSRAASTETTSWLDTIDESASSASSSRLSSLDFRPGIASNLFDEIEAEFDAALNAAVDSAYHDHSRPDTTEPRQTDAPVGTPQTVHRESLANAMPKEREQPSLLSLANNINFDHPDPPSESKQQRESNTGSQFYDEEAEEEERLLDEMTRGYDFGDFHFDKQSLSALPRQSDSSGFSGRTWPSSNGSTTVTNGTSLSTLAEIMEASSTQKVQQLRATSVGNLPPPVPTSEPPPPPPAATVPTIEEPSGPIESRKSFDKTVAPGVRDRRLSGQNARQLKIETNSRPGRSMSINQQTPKVKPAPMPTVQVPSSVEPEVPSLENQYQMQLGPLSNTTSIQPLTPMASIYSGDSYQGDSPVTPTLTQGESQINVDEAIPLPASPAQHAHKGLGATMRKNMSTSSLRMRNLSVVTVDHNDSPITLGGETFPPELRPGVAKSHHTFTLSGPPVGGMYLFDNQIGTPNTPRTPASTSSANANIPAPLEPCPESYLLRPFWLMRCLYQTIAHPRGGYITTKLFVPRDIWRVKNVKLKAVDDKISQCDLLSAALLKLAKVDHLDAEAVLEEMQAFEMVLETVRTTLQKKLGSDVGLAGSASMFKSGPLSPDESADPMGPKSANAAKSFASSWRKLRSKSSSAQMSSSYVALPQKENGKDAGFVIPSLPMAHSSGLHQSSRTQARRNPQSINLSSLGPNANYMAALARLFDAAQILDSIARQVEDPGLKCSSKTHVGLELCVRNASEFFAFFVVRWVIADVGGLLDKFIKRGGEWVMS